MALEKEGREYEISEQKEIEQAAFLYYRDLFQEKSTSNETIEDFLGETSTRLCQKLFDDKKQKMEGIITEEELTTHIKKVKNITSSIILQDGANK